MDFIVFLFRVCVCLCFFLAARFAANCFLLCVRGCLKIAKPYVICSPLFLLHMEYGIFDFEYEWMSGLE